MLQCICRWEIDVMCRGTSASTTRSLTIQYREGCLASAPSAPGFCTFTNKRADKILDQCKAHKTIRPMLNS
jgi:hypothetical protein